MKNSLPAVEDVAEWQRQFDHLDTKVGSWVVHVPTFETVQTTHKELLALEMECSDFDLSQRINWLFKAIKRVREVLPHLDPAEVDKVLGALNVPTYDGNFKRGLKASNNTLIFYFAIWDGRHRYKGRAEKIGAELRRRAKNDPTRTIKKETGE